MYSDSEMGTPVSVEDQLFHMFKEDAGDFIHMGKFLTALFETGLRRSDPRLKELMDKITQEMYTRADNPHSASIATLTLEKAAFHEVIKDNILLISQALRHHLVIPEWREFTSYIEEFY